MTDFFSTYIGIQKQIIVEGNPLMVWLFELSFLVSLLVRLLMFAVVAYMPITLMKKYSHKVRPSIRKLYYWGAFAGNFGVMAIHLYWIIGYSLMNILYPI
jgi:hypothetical protein